MAVITAAMALAGCGDDASPEVVEHDTALTIAVDAGRLYHGEVNSQSRECEGGRRVVLLERRTGADRKLGTVRNPDSGPDRGTWGLWLAPGELQQGDVYAKVRRKLGDEVICREGRSKTLSRPEEVD
jgi:hypothetical protein